MLEHTIDGTLIQLLPDKAIYLAKEKMLFIADLHLGKVNHFRRSGISVPNKANDKNLDRLIKLIQNLDLERVIFLGDLFHSHYNSEWEVFGQVLQSFPAISFELVIGNHDIMSTHQYEKYKIAIHDKPLKESIFVLSHEPLEEPFEGYNLAGHIHPSVRLTGKGKQRLKFPCFYFGHNQGLLPAFGEFTGTHAITPKKGDNVFVIVEGIIIEVK